MIYYKRFICTYISVSGATGSGDIRIYDGRESHPEPIATVNIHTQTVQRIAFNEPLNFVASFDSAAMVEFWDIETTDLPKTVSFDSKLDTDLWEFLKVLC